ncbi:MAG TPA: NADH-quinone oxidoreductase subunit J, partial [Actinomycetota bacterium]|nr:NADH-quinone oxidoreductase subunit J [Actinomycetota bacterium]
RTQSVKRRWPRSAVGIVTAFGGTELQMRYAFPTADLGQRLFTDWVLPFEALSVLLLAALIGAIVLARRD